MLSGIGHIIAGLTIRANQTKQLEPVEEPPLRIDSSRSFAAAAPDNTAAGIRPTPTSVTERTTNILDRDPQWQK
jgi:hypothetical protein